MHLSKVWSISVFIIISSCKQTPAHVRFYDDEDVQVLNEKVKQLLIRQHDNNGDNLKTVDFDRNGNILQMTMRDAEFVISQDSIITNSTVKYSFLTSANENTRILKGFYSWKSTARGYEPANGSSRWEFGQDDRIVKFLPDVTLPGQGIYSYDKNGNMVGYKQSFDSEQKSNLYHYKYDINHRLTEILLYEENNPNKDRLLMKHSF